MRVRCRLAAAALLLAVGCVDGDTAEPTLDQPVAEPAATGASPGCDGAPPPAGTTTAEVHGGGDHRSYLLHTPPPDPDAQPAPLVLNFHGFASNAGDQADYSGLHDAADDLGFVVATPEGRGLLGQWDLPPGEGAATDVAMVVQLVDEVAAQRCVDLDRLFAVGLSNGAAFATVLSCQLDATLTGVAPVAGVNLVEPCPDRRPVAVVAFHGTDDDVVPYDGGNVLFGLAGSEPVEDVMAAWARRNRCRAGPDDERAGPEVRLLAWSGCEAPVELFVVDGGGHTWPGADRVRGLGHVTDDIDASRLALERFASASWAPRR